MRRWHGTRTTPTPAAVQVCKLSAHVDMDHTTLNKSAWNAHSLSRTYMALVTPPYIETRA